MKRHSIIGIGALCVLSSLQVSASEIAGHLKGETLKWISAASQASYLVPSLWDISMNLPPASQIIPGGPENIGPQTITLHGSEGGTVTVPMTVEGMQFELASNVLVNHDSGGTSSSDAQVGRKQVTVLGSGISDKIISLAQTETPFTHYRPLIKAIDTSVWVKAFRAARAPAGAYRGTLVVKVPYEYYREGIRIHNTIALPLTVLLDYTPAVLTSIQVEGNDVITPRYYGYPQTLVGGETEYTVTATGIFPNGVLVGLSSSADPYYKLKPMRSVSPETEIRYSVTCSSGCESGKTQFIIDGQPQIDNSANQAKIVSNSAGTQAQARLTVSFKDKKLTELNADTYVGSFILIFSADM